MTVETVQAEVARQFGLHVNDLRGNRRTQDVAYARQIAMYLARGLTEASLPQIGARFGGRHHTTVIYAVDKIDRQLKDGHDPQLQDLVELISASASRPLAEAFAPLLRGAPSLFSTGLVDNHLGTGGRSPSRRANRLCFPLPDGPSREERRLLHTSSTVPCRGGYHSHAGGNAALHIVNRCYDDDEVTLSSLYCHKESG